MRNNHGNCGKNVATANAVLMLSAVNTSSPDDNVTWNDDDDDTAKSIMEAVDATSSIDANEYRLVVKLGKF